MESPLIEYTLLLHPTNSVRILPDALFNFAHDFLIFGWLKLMLDGISLCLKEEMKEISAEASDQVISFY